MVGYELNASYGGRLDQLRKRRLYPSYGGRLQLRPISTPYCSARRDFRPQSPAERRRRCEQYQATLQEKENLSFDVVTPTTSMPQSPSRLSTAKQLRSISKMRFLHKRKAFKKKKNFKDAIPPQAQ